MINHQDNFITSLTSGISAGATTAPLASIPTIDAPFYLAFDATNLNGNYEIRMVSSKTATNVNFLACSFPHSADEEVRMVIPSWEADKIYQAPQGFLLNGKIVPSVTSNNLTVALKTLAGTDPSTSNPVHIRIGDTVRTITSALSVTANAGTNWCNAGGTLKATTLQKYSVYLGYNATDGVFIGFSPIDYATIASEFSSTATSEKAMLASWTTQDGTVENIGRFSATLSAGAGHTWSVPTFTSENLIQRPIRDIVSGVRVYNNAVQVLGSGSPANITFNSETYNTDGMHSTSIDPERIYATRSGLYFVKAQVCYASNATGRRQSFLARSSGTSLAGVESVAVNGAATVHNFSTVLNLNIGDYIILVAFQTSGGDLNVGDGSDSYAGTHVEMVRIGQI